MQAPEPRFPPHKRTFFLVTGFHLNHVVPTQKVEENTAADPVIVA